MPSIAQQDYIIIAPKEGRALNQDAAAMGQLKKAVLNGTSFDCLLKHFQEPLANTLDRVLGIGIDGSSGGAAIHISNIADNSVEVLELLYTPEQYSGLATVQEAEDIELGEVLTEMPSLVKANSGLIENILVENAGGYLICVNGKYLIVTGEETITALAISDEGPGESDGFVNISWEDAQKLIGLPIV